MYWSDSNLQLAISIYCINIQSRFAGGSWPRSHVRLRLMKSVLIHATHRRHYYPFAKDYYSREQHSRAALELARNDFPLTEYPTASICNTSFRFAISPLQSAIAGLITGSRRLFGRVRSSRPYSRTLGGRFAAEATRLVFTRSARTHVEQRHRQCDRQD